MDQSPRPCCWRSSRSIMPALRVKETRVRIHPPGGPIVEKTLGQALKTLGSVEAALQTMDLQIQPRPWSRKSTLVSRQITVAGMRM